MELTRDEAGQCETNSGEKKAMRGADKGRGKERVEGDG